MSEVLSSMPADASTTQDRGSPRMSLDTSSARVTPTHWRHLPAASFSRSAVSAARGRGRERRRVTSTAATAAVGTRKVAAPTRPDTPGSTSASAGARREVPGDTFCREPRPARQSLVSGPSTVFWPAVLGQTTVTAAASTPARWCARCTTGAAAWSSKGPRESASARKGTASAKQGATMGRPGQAPATITFLAPARRLSAACASEPQSPVQSTTISARADAHGTAPASRQAKTATRCLPPTSSAGPPASVVVTCTLSGKGPWEESRARR
mmetsp:Transcript_20605/g.60867  ORF Transcript_20605/g.60867 Transcript_20605/m.60867 type:complete len:269 (-) Transcript_20605:1183-1989(-)